MQISYRVLCEIGNGFSNLIENVNRLCRRRECYICKETFPFYKPVFGQQWYKDQLKRYGRNTNFLDMTYNRWEFLCPYCKSQDRTRFIMMYIKQKYKNKKGLKVLYFAPTYGGVFFLRENMTGVKIDTDDLYEEDVTFHYDIQNLSGIIDNTYDLLICSHVLEHVADDHAALKELYRVLKPGGEAMILVPLDLKREWFDEENGLSEDENWYRFGQSDHVRRYTDAIIRTRIEKVGFKCRIYDRGNVSAQLIKKNAFNKCIRIYIAQKR